MLQKRQSSHIQPSQGFLPEPVTCDFLQKGYSVVIRHSLGSPSLFASDMCMTWLQVYVVYRGSLHAALSSRTTPSSLSRQIFHLDSLIHLRSDKSPDTARFWVSVRNKHVCKLKATASNVQLCMCNNTSISKLAHTLKQVLPLNPCI